MTLLGKYKGLVWLMMLLLIAPLLVWQYALKGTLSQWYSTTKARQQIETLWTDRPQTTTLNQSATSCEMILSGEFVSKLLSFITSEGIRINHFSPYITSKEDGMQLTSGKLMVEGEYIEIVKLLEHIECELPQCKIISVEFRADKALICTIYIQQLTVVDE